MDVGGTPGCRTGAIVERVLDTYRMLWAQQFWAHRLTPDRQLSGGCILPWIF